MAEYQFEGIIFAASACYYCGLPATTVDHVIPRTLLWRRDFFREEGFDFPVDVNVKIVPSCHNCNSVLGSRVFRTLKDRRAAVKDHLCQKYYHLLFDTPDWTDSELEELGRTLKSAVLARQRLKDIVRRRLAWPKILGGRFPGSVRFVQPNLRQFVHPSTSVQTPVDLRSGQGAINEFGNSDKVCQYCGSRIPLRRLMRLKTDKVYCSLRCKERVRRGVPLVRQCQYCGDPISKFRGANALYCSAICVERRYLSVHNGTRTSSPS